MATAGEARRRARKAAGAKPADRPQVDLPFSRKNYIIFGLAAAVIVVGYIALSSGSITLAPILLLLGYLVLIPWGILAK
jgi:predicted Rossmann fold nucleotide-binding protein DprA/Smf involved in DNA uptake